MVSHKNRNIRNRPEEDEMAIDKAFYDLWTPRALAVLRIVTGYLMLDHGVAKIFHFPHVAMFDNVQIFSLIVVAGILELIGGALILIGSFTRLSAFILSGEMAVAYFMAHASKGAVLMPMLNQGELAVLYCFVFLFLSVAGAGAWSVDALTSRSSEGKRDAHWRLVSQK
jgi:putative oxidoreductase